MKIGKPQIVQKDNQTVYRVRVESAKGNDTLWYGLPESFTDLLSNSCDAPLVALLIPAMSMGEDIHIEGKISDKLLYNLSGPLQSLLQRVIPSLKQIKIYPEDRLSDKVHSPTGVATGFSGGIDSFCVLADHYYNGGPVGFRLTHLLFNDVGSHGVGGERLFRERYERLRHTAELVGLPFIMINSNLASFYGKGLHFQQTHTLRNASVALLLQDGLERYMYASTFNYSEVFIGPTYDTAYSDAVTLPLLSTNTLDAFSVGSQYTRVNKTVRVAEIPDSYTTLDVCVNANNTSGYTNCSRCWKCLRTLATLEIAGYLERYSPVFDLNIYRSQREKYFSTLIGSHDPLLREIVAFARHRNYSIPISSRLFHYSGIYPISEFSKRALHKLRRLTTRSK